MTIPYLNRHGEEVIKTFDRSQGIEAARKYLARIPMALTLSPDGEAYLNEKIQREIDETS